MVENLVLATSYQLQKQEQETTLIHAQTLALTNQELAYQ